MKLCIYCGSTIDSFGRCARCSSPMISSSLPIFDSPRTYQNERPTMVKCSHCGWEGFLAQCKKDGDQCPACEENI
jgi:hypothetical protein